MILYAVCSAFNLRVKIRPVLDQTIYYWGQTSESAVEGDAVLNGEGADEEGSKYYLNFAFHTLSP